MTRYEDTLVLKDAVSPALLKMTAKFGKLDKAIDKNIKGLEKLRARSERLNQVGQGFKNFGRNLTMGVTLPIIALGGYATKMGMEFQDAEMRLQTMLGSAEKGSKLFKDIVEMGARTPFQAKDLLQASTLMLNFGISEKKVIPYMQQLGDISGGNAERFQSLALAFSQVASAGRLQGQDLLQLINAGFNPLQVISQKTGRSMSDLKEDMSKGKISFEMLTEAMEIATGKGGRFNGMMDKMSKTASGKLSTMLDNFNTAMADFGKVILPPVTKGIEVITKLLNVFVQMPKPIKITIVILGVLAAALGPVVTILGSLIVALANLPSALLTVKAGMLLFSGAIKGVGVAILGLGKAMLTLLANPIVLWVLGITAAIAGLIFAIKKLVGWWKKLKGTTDDGINANIASNVGSGVSNNYRQNNISNSNTSNVTNNNYYGNMVLDNMNPLKGMLNGGMIPLGV